MKFVAVASAVMLLAGISLSAFADGPAPIAFSNKDVGGGPLNQYTPGVEGGIGLNNIGLLIRTWGRVTFVDTINKFFYINDGANRDDGSGHIGLRVSYDNLAPGNTIEPPPVGSYVAVTCICSTWLNPADKIHPNLRPRRQDDITVIALPGS
ncbi:MAG: hypothetical protein ACUVRS_10630 [Armatimonadota bacterium]